MRRLVVSDILPCYCATILTVVHKRCKSVISRNSRKINSHTVTVSKHDFFTPITEKVGCKTRIWLCTVIYWTRQCWIFTVIINSFRTAFYAVFYKFISVKQFSSQITVPINCKILHIASIGIRYISYFFTCLIIYTVSRYRPEQRKITAWQCIIIIDIIHNTSAYISLCGL